ncbi:MAG: ABC transporter permease, partial [Pseudomonadota bacterium]|nr:ABC transporter permease [Pseudomonadota bacterium]
MTTAADPAEETIRLESRAWKKLKANKSALFGFIIVAFFIGIAVAAPLLPIADPAATSWSAVRKAPSAAHWLGTDEIGRDILSRMIWGAQASLMAGVISVAIVVVTGVPIGLIAGYFGGWTDTIISRFTDA